MAADALMVLSAAPPAALPQPAFEPDLDAVLAPKSVAIVGASDNVTRWGGSALQNILAGGFEGAIYPSIPRAASSSACRSRRVSRKCLRRPISRCSRSAPSSSSP